MSLPVAISLTATPLSTEEEGPNDIPTEYCIIIQNPHLPEY